MINVRAIEDNKETIIYIQGYFDINSTYKVEKAWDDALENNPLIVMFNCADLIFIDSSAIGTLLKLTLQAKENEIQMILVNLKPEIKDLFIKNNLVHLFTFKDLLHFEADCIQRI